MNAVKEVAASTAQAATGGQVPPPAPSPAPSGGSVDVGTSDPNPQPASLPSESPAALADGVRGAVEETAKQISTAAPQVARNTVDRTVASVPVVVDQTAGVTSQVVDRAAAEVPAVTGLTERLPATPDGVAVPALDRAPDSPGGGRGPAPAPRAETGAPGDSGGAPVPAGPPAAPAVPIPLPPTAGIEDPHGLELGVRGVIRNSPGPGHRQILDWRAATPPGAIGLGDGEGPLTSAAAHASTAPSPHSAEQPAGPVSNRSGPPLFPAPASASSGPGGASFVPFAALIALLALLAPATFSRLREVVGPRVGAPFVCALERPG